MKRWIKSWLGPTVLNWTQLNALSASKAIRSSYFWFFFVPIVAKLLGTANVISFKIYEQQFTVDLSLPFTWEVFFYSAVFMAIANLIHKLCCPEFIKTYPTCTVFIEQGRTGHQVLQQFTVFVYAASKRETKEQIGPNVCDFLKSYCEHGVELEKELRTSKITALQALSRAKIADNQECGAFYHAQAFIDRRLPPWRTLCSYSYWIGFLLIAVVLCENVIFVVEAHLLN